MTIDEAIARIREVAEKHRNNIVPKERYHNMPWIDKSNEVSMRSAEEHEQLAEWLELLKWYEQGMEDIPCESGVLPKDVYWAGYNKAIDDFSEKAIQIVYYSNDRKINPQPRDMVADIHYKLLDLAEQLKAYVDRL